MKVTVNNPPQPSLTFADLAIGDVFSTAGPEEFRYPRVKIESD